MRDVVSEEGVVLADFQQKHEWGTQACTEVRGRTWNVFSIVRESETVGVKGDGKNSVALHYMGDGHIKWTYYDTGFDNELDRQEGRTEHDSGNRDGNGIKNSSTVNKNPIEQPVEVVSLCARSNRRALSKCVMHCEHNPVSDGAPVHQREWPSCSSRSV